MIIIPPHQSNQGTDPRKEAHDLTVGMFVVFVILVAIALFIFILGPRSNNPPPLIVGVAVSGFACLFGAIAFFAWQKEQGDFPDSSDSNSSSES